MKIPMKVDYGVRALVELALHHGEGHIQTSVIAYKQGIPEAYLDQLMTSLNKFDFVASRRGPQGGHSLAMDPKDIDLNMVMQSREKYVDACPLGPLPVFTADDIKMCLQQFSKDEY